MTVPLTQVIWLSVTFFLLWGGVNTTSTKDVRPLVLWHGLGDTYGSSGMLDFASRIKKIHPGIFIHSIFIDKDQGRDRRAGFYGNVNDQLESVYQQLSAIPELKDGFDAIGLSQGGQFLRAFVERYNSPPVNNLITFGSQHMGISDIPGCRPRDFICQVARRAAKGAMYGEWVQNNIVQAQYFRDSNNIETYLKANHFLASINNEILNQRNDTYAKNLASLNRLVLVIFTDDKTVIPKESSWFGSEAEPPKDFDFRVPGQIILSSLNHEIIPMRLQPLYVEDWIGLRTLDERGGVEFDSCPGGHMQMGDCWERIVYRYVGGMF